MSDENPYGGAGEPPGEQPPGEQSPYRGYPTPPPPDDSAPAQRTDRWKIWVGIALAIPLLIATGVLAGLMGVVDDSGSLSGIAGIAGLLVPIALLFPASTRKIGVGLLIGYAAILVLGAGACIVLLASYS